MSIRAGATRAGSKRGRCRFLQVFAFRLRKPLELGIACNFFSTSKAEVLGEKDHDGACTDWEMNLVK